MTIERSSETARSRTTALIDELIATGEQIVSAGLSRGSGGNASVLTDDGLVIITPTGASLGSLDAARMSVVSMDGTRLRGDAPSKEVPLHLEMYRRNPSHRAVIHLHSPHATAASCLTPWSRNSALPPLTPYFVMRAGQTPLVPYAAPGSAAAAERLSEVEVPFTSALLQNHGQITSGPSLTTALECAIEVEEAARATLLTTGGERRLLTDDEIAELTERHGAFWTFDGR